MDSEVPAFGMNYPTQNAPIQRLPAELYVLVMEHCESPLQIKSLISADPVALCYYMDSRHHILRLCERNLPAGIDDEDSIRTTTLAVRLRNLRRNATLYTAMEYEQQVLFYTNFADTCGTNQWPTSLGFFCSLYDLVSDANELMSHYVPELIQEQQNFAKNTNARNQNFHHFMRRLAEKLGVELTSPGRKESVRSMDLSSTEMAWLYRAIFRVESRSSAIYHHGNIPFLHALNDDSVVTPDDLAYINGGMAQEVVELYSILHCVYTEHRHIFDRVKEEVETLISRIMQRQKDHYLFNKQHIESTISGDIKSDKSIPHHMAKRYSRIWNLKTRGEYQLDEYLEYLCSRGISMLHRLQNMDLQAQEKFTIDTFFYMTFRGSVEAEINPQYQPPSPLGLFYRPHWIPMLGDWTVRHNLQTASQELDIWPFWQDHNLVHREMPQMRVEIDDVLAEAG